MNTTLDTRHRSPMQEKIHAYNEALVQEIEARERGELTLELINARKAAYIALLGAQSTYLKSFAA